MASEGGGKIKNKRGHSSAKPYERRQSLFRRITDSIKDVLRPSWLSSEVSGDDGSVVLVSAEPRDYQLGDAASAVTRTSEVSSQQPFQHDSEPSPAGNAQGDHKRRNQPSTSSSNTESMLQHTQAHLNNQHQNPVANVRFSWQQHPQQMPSSQQSDLASSTLVSHSDNSQLVMSFSTSVKHQHQGVGSWQSVNRQRGLAPAAASTNVLPTIQPRQRRLRMSESEMSLQQASASSTSPPQVDVSNRDQTVLAGSMSLLGDSPTLGGADVSPLAIDSSAAKRQRLWSPETPRKGRFLQPAVQEKPGFKISVFCSPGQNLNESLHESTFYSGKTTFGGASAYQRRSLNSSLPYQNSLPLRKPVTAKPLNSTSNAVLSSSATQILKTLERLSEAKKAQASESGMDSVLSFTPSSYRKPSRPLQTATPSRMLEIPSRGPPTSRLQAPAAASIARNHQVVTLTAPRSHQLQQPSTSQNRRSEDDVQVVEDLPAKAVSRHDAPQDVAGKMKRVKTYETRPKARREEDEVVELPNLRTDFTLPIQSMPTFNLGVMTSVPPASKPAASATAAIGTGTLPPLQFTFSSPIHKTGPNPTGNTPSTTEGFQFSSPLRVAQSTPPTLDKSPVWGSTAPKAKSVSFGLIVGKSANQLSEGLGASGTSSMSVASASSSGSPPKAAPQLLSGSVMDVLGGGKSDAAAAASPPISSMKPAASLKQGSVMDILGKGSPFVSSATSPAKSPADSSSAKSSAPTDDLFAKFKKPTGSWECGMCMVQNKPEATKCVCCETPKPGASSAAAAISNAPADNLFAKFKKPAGSWECGTCMVQNKPEATKCGCCETPKPGASFAAANSAPSTSASSGSGTDSLFAKFQKPPGAWDCDMCLAQNKADATKCVACETPKPGSKPAAEPAPATKTDDLFAKFHKPAGSWDCDVCLVQNGEAQTKCLACESPRSTGTAPSGSSGSSASASAASMGPGGGLVLSMSSSSSSSAASPFLTAGATQKKDSTATGFTFGGATSSGSSGSFTFGGVTVSTSGGAKPPAAGEFQLPSSGTTTSQDSSANTGFKLGDKDSSNSNSASSANSVVFGNTDSIKSDSISQASLSGGFKFGSTTSPLSGTGTTTAPGGGFQFGSTNSVSSSSVGAGLSQTQVTSTGSVSSAPVTTASSTAPVLGLGLASGAAGFSFGTSSTTSSVDAKAKNNGVSVTVADSAKKTGTSEPVKSTFTPVFGLGQPANSNSLGAGPSVTSGGFQFGASGKSDSSVFGSNLTSKVSFPGSNEPVKSESGVGGTKAPSISGGFSFTAAAKPNNEAAPQAGLFSMPAVGKNGESAPLSGFVFGSGVLASSTTPSASGFAFGAGASTPATTTTTAATPSGFAFGTSTPTTNTTTSLFGSAPQPNSWSGMDNAARPLLPKPDLGVTKPTVNGEVGVPSGAFVFGQQSDSAPTTGFAFGAQINSVADNTASQPKPVFGFGADATSAGSKRTHDQNDTGGSDSKKRDLNFTRGAAPTGGAETFKFIATAPAASNMFKFGQTTDGATDKAASIPSFGGTATGFGSTPQAGFFSGSQNSAGSAPSVFGSGGAGHSGTNTGQFSFSIGTNTQGGAAAPSAFPTNSVSSGFGNGSTATGFNFQPGAPSFNFGSSSGGATGAPIFQFGGTPAADAAPAQPSGGGIFAFGQSSQPADSTTPTPGFTAPPGLPFGNPAGGAPANFTIGSGGDPTRKIKRAVRRGARK